MNPRYVTLYRNFLPIGLFIIIFTQAYEMRKRRVKSAEQWTQYREQTLQFASNAMWIAFYEGSFRRQNAEEQFSNYVSNTIAGLRTPE
jgi:hypothetical protein